MKVVMFFLLLNLTGIIPAETIQLNTADSAPYSKTDDTGFYDILLKEVFKTIGYTIEINHYPSERSLQWANDGHNDGEFARISGLSETYVNLIEVTEPLVSFNFVAVKRKDNSISVTSWEDLKSLRVGFLNGWKIYEENVGSYPHVIRYNDIDSMIKVLLSDRLDVILYSKLRAEEYIRNFNIQGLEVITPPLSVRTMHLYLHNSIPDLAKQVNEALKDVKYSGRYDEIYNQYLVR